MANSKDIKKIDDTNYEAEINELKKNIVELKTVVEGQAKETAGKVKKETANITSTLKTVANDLGSNIGEIFEGSKETFSENANKVSNKIAKNPLKSAAIAAGIGAAVALILKK